MARRHSRRSVTEEPEEAPRSRRSRSSRDDEEAPRSRRSRSSRDDEDDSPEEAPRSRRSRSSRDEEPRSRRSRRSTNEDVEWPDDEEDSEDSSPEERPARSRRSSSRSEKSSSGKRRASSRRGRDDDDEDDSNPVRGDIPTGWSGYKSAKSSIPQTGDIDWKNDVWQPDDEETLVAFVEDAPFASYAQHWVGRSVVCPESIIGDEQECPICQTTGDQPRVQVLFNVIVFDGEGIPHGKVLRAGKILSDALEGIADGKRGPLTRYYWEMTATGNKGSYNVNILPTTEEQVEEDWRFEPLSEEELEEFYEDRWDSGIVYRHSYDDLKKFARKMNRGD